MLLLLRSWHTCPNGMPYGETRTQFLSRRLWYALIVEWILLGGTLNGGALLLSHHQQEVSISHDKTILDCAIERYGIRTFCETRAGQIYVLHMVTEKSTSTVTSTYITLLYDRNLIFPPFMARQQGSQQLHSAHKTVTFHQTSITLFHSTLSC